MAIIKCKMCGGDLILEEGSNVAECEYCGSRQTVPSADNEKKLNLFARANRLRANNEFDKASGVYESIVADFPEEAEAYWGLILCKYGIEYVDDPGTGKKIPTCHRSSFDSVMDDPNFELVMEYADTIARRVYREEAKQIEELRKRIIEVSSKEEPYDIFICYKETDENGQRTLDSVLAQDIYDMLTENGYRVFFSRVTLEDKLGVEYEPYIFAALNSAKIMLAFGTDYDYYNAVWVKNEWSRFLQLIAKGEKKTLIPCYKNIDAYDMPKEFAKLQAQDLGKVGANQDLLRGIKKILPKGEEKQPALAPQQIVQQIVQTGSGPNVTALLKRGNMALEDKGWEKAKEYFDQVLNMDAENHDAFLGLAMANGKFADRDSFRKAYCATDFSLRSIEVKKAKRFANSEQLLWWKQLDSERQAAEEAKRSLEKRLSDYFTAYVLMDKLKISASGSLVFRDETDPNAEDLNLDSWGTVTQCQKVGYDGMIGLRSDGTVIQLDLDESIADCVEKWTGITQIVGGGKFVAGLCSDGTVCVAEKEHKDSLSSVKKWKEIKMIAASDYILIGLREDGSVVAAHTDFGYSKARNCTEWQGVKQIAAVSYDYSDNFIALKLDGTIEGSDKYVSREYQYQDVEKFYAYQSDEFEAQSFVILQNRNGSYRYAKKEKELPDAAMLTDVYRNRFCVYQDGSVWDIKTKKPLPLDWEESTSFSASLKQAVLRFGRRMEADNKHIRMQAMIRLLICDKKLNALDRTEYDQAFLAAFGGTYALDPNSWKNIVSVSCEDMKIVGLRENGMTVASGFSPEDTEEHEAQKTITAWNHLADISLHGNEVVGLKSSGDIVIKKIKKEKDSNLSVCGWKDVISITGRSYELYGLVYDGTILMTCPSWLKLTTPKWTGITALKCAGNGLLAGLDKNGRVVFDGKIAAWEGITKLAGGGSQIIGLKTDGTVCAAGSNGANQAETSEWKNIVAIAAAADFSYGLCADGTVVATSIVPGVEVGPALFGELEGSVRKLLAQKAAQIREEERIAEQCRKEENDRKCRELSEKIAAAQQRQSAAKTELANLKGLFTGKRRKELEAEIASLDRQIADLQKQLDAIRD